MNNIYVIGVFGVGKTTLSKLLSKEKNKKLISLDFIRWSIYEKIGYDFNYIEQLVKRKKFIDLYRYNSKFEIELVKETIMNTSDSVIDFGAGHSIIESESTFNYIRKLMKERGITIFLDKKIISNHTNIHPEEKFLNSYFLASKCNQKLSDITVMIDNKNKSQILNEVLNKLESFEK
ncbi:shikimate kinase [Proteus mirabilis]|uniref:shikimate kinase n=1 Tax=Proteus mirabilis TaxID=584 RepID=UPI0023623AF0|nr:shikimate kinase [Proteus mirabilis]MDC9767739.1 shikimate kinase [Proteus mirabilis]